jgi:hypothetical protein
LLQQRRSMDNSCRSKSVWQYWQYAAHTSVDRLFEDVFLTGQRWFRMRKTQLVKGHAGCRAMQPWGEAEWECQGGGDPLRTLHTRTQAHTHSRELPHTLPPAENSPPALRITLSPLESSSSSTLIPAHRSARRCASAGHVTWLWLCTCVAGR